MFEDILNHFASNLPLISVSVVMYFIAIRNIKVRRRESIYFIVFTSIVLALAFIVEAEKHGINHNNVYLATVFTSLGYILRPILIYVFVLLANMDKKHSQKFYLLWGLPLIIGTILYIFPLCFGAPGLSTFVFSYTQGADGFLDFHRGSFLNFYSHFISAGYLGLLIYISVNKFHSKHVRDAIILFICAGIIVLTVTVETIMQRSDLLNITCAICALVNYIFIITVSSAKDSLTGLYDRRTFEIDISRYKNLINGVVQIDMNELKYLNDHFGHDAGDIALNTLAKIFVESIDKSTMCVYRLSGDEFLIIMFKGKKEALDHTVELIKQKIASTMYAAAIGSYFIDEQSTATFEEAMRISEELMYVDKGKYYQTSEHDRRKQ